MLLQQRDSLSEINNNTALNYFIQSSHPAWAAHCLSWHWNHPPLHLCQHTIPSSGRTTGDVPCEFYPFVPIVPNGAFILLALLLLLGVPTPWPRTTRHPKPLECNCTWRHPLGKEIPEPFQMHSATLQTDRHQTPPPEVAVETIGKLRESDSLGKSKWKIDGWWNNEASLSLRNPIVGLFSSNKARLHHNRIKSFSSYYSYYSSSPAVGNFIAVPSLSQAVYPCQQTRPLSAGRIIWHFKSPCLVAACESIYWGWAVLKWVCGKFLSTRPGTGRIQDPRYPVLTQGTDTMCLFVLMWIQKCLPMYLESFILVLGFSKMQTLV